MRSTANKREIENFTTLASHWWDESGPMKPLHALNPVRLRILKDWIGEVKGKMVLDVGCGGGIVCEPLSRMGAKVTGIDAGTENIEVAKAHAEQSGLEITYKATTAEDYALRHGGQFDVVLALEIIEHVDEPDLFIASLLKLCKPKGTIIISTINRNAKAFALAKIAAEYILRWVPAGTHDFKKFRKPSEIAAWFGDNAKITDMRGLVYDPLKRAFVESKRDMNVNYFVCAIKS